MTAVESSQAMESSLGATGQCAEPASLAAAESNGLPKTKTLEPLPLEETQDSAKAEAIRPASNARFWALQKQLCEAHQEVCAPLRNSLRYMYLYL